jgi:hypothetical protein
MFRSGGSPIEYALSNDSDTEMAATDDSVRKKTHIIAAVLDSIAEIAGPPLLVGFAEIEDASLSSAIAENVRSASLSTVDATAQDETGFALEGLDLSLLFDVDYFQGVSKLRSHVINRTFITRDILECDLQLKSRDMLSVLLNHWPSRMVGEAAGQRITAAHYTRSLIASKTRFSPGEMWDPENRSIHVPRMEDLEKRALTPVVVMGDFNDEMFDSSIELLGSTNDREAILNDLKVKGQSKKKRFRSYTSSTPQMYNPFWSLAGRGGSYYRSPRWRCYDQILLSRGFLEQNGPLRFVSASESVFSKDHVALADGSVAQLTNRNGKPIAYEPANHRGCSDHFAVFVSIDA